MIQFLCPGSSFFSIALSSTIHPNITFSHFTHTSTHATSHPPPLLPHDESAYSPRTILRSRAYRTVPVNSIDLLVVKLRLGGGLPSTFFAFAFASVSGEWILCRFHRQRSRKRMRKRRVPGCRGGGSWGRWVRGGGSGDCRRC